MFQLQGKVALITGALGTIGKCVVRELLKHEVKGIALLDIDDSHANCFQEEIRNEFGDGKMIFLKVDVTDAAQIEDAYENIVKHFKQLDIVINNAGIADADHLKSFMTNFVATAYSTNLAFTKYLETYRAGEEGVIINNSSIAGLHPYPIYPAYSSSKHGVVALGRCLGHEVYYNKRKIKVMTICPAKTEAPALLGQRYDCLEEMHHLVKEVFETAICQRPESVATAIIEIIKNGKTGSTWVAKLDQPPIEVDFSAIDKITYALVT